MLTDSDLKSNQNNKGHWGSKIIKRKCIVYSGNQRTNINPHLADCMQLIRICTILRTRSERMSVTCDAQIHYKNVN